MEVLVKRAFTRLLAARVALPLFFLATAGSATWWEAWFYCALILVPMTLFVIWMAPRDPAFFERRFRLKEKEQS